MINIDLFPLNLIITNHCFNITIILVIGNLSFCQCELSHFILIL
jgi:hypothetical protein